MTIAAKIAFDRAIALKIGEKIKLPVHSEAQQESLRVQLSRERSKFITATVLDFDILVKRSTDETGRYVILEKASRLDTGFIQKLDGSVEQFSLDPDKVTDFARDAIESTRIRTLMEQDGYSKEEIEAYLAGEQGVSINDSLSKNECKEE